MIVSPIDSLGIRYASHHFASDRSTVFKSVSMNGEQLMIRSLSLRSPESLLAISLFMNTTPAMSTKMIFSWASRWRTQAASNSE
jgi:hypothetical protein